MPDLLKVNDDADGASGVATCTAIYGIQSLAVYATWLQACERPGVVPAADRLADLTRIWRPHLQLLEGSAEPGWRIRYSGSIYRHLSRAGCPSGFADNRKLLDRAVGGRLPVYRVVATTDMGGMHCVIEELSLPLAGARMLCAVFIHADRPRRIIDLRFSPDADRWTLSRCLIEP